MDIQSYHKLMSEIKALSHDQNNAVNIIAVSKKQASEKIRIIANEGHKHFGENQIQEIEQKWPALKEEFPNIKLHFIGTIQSRKTERIFELCDEIHSVDRIKIVKQIKELEQKFGIVKTYYIQVNTGDELQKSGVKLNDIDDFIRTVRAEYNFSIDGLMCLPPQNDDPNKHFLSLKSIAESHNIQKLSMGMSADYKEAINCGSTHLRVGTLIFGKRD
tara:strand:- start:54 stop:704 length:651 start_codon:yes stop_codon:yes gene_type:complete